MAKKVYLVFILLLAGIVNAKAQFADSLKIEVGTIGTYASKEYQPLWLTSNRFGTIADRKSDLSTNVKLSNAHYFSAGKADTTAKSFYIKYAANVFNNQHFNEVFAEEAYLKAGFKKLQFSVGRFEETPGELDPSTSSGSLGISGNALPIPKIGFAITDYTAVPFTKGFAQFKGQISHGWFGNNRYMKDAFYHEKIFYLQLGKNKFKLYAGVQHFVEWGGKRDNIQLDRSFKGFLDVLLVREADDGSVGTATNGILPNRPGDQRGLFEAGFKWENETLAISGYQQTPFETGRDVDIRNVDRLVGLNFLSKKNNAFFKSITAEFLYTFDMLSFVEAADRQSYYNNGYYKTGWEYNDRIVGTPLFINRVRASKYFSSVVPYNWDAPSNSIQGNNNIINNRVVAFHAGATYTPAKNTEAKTLVTYTINYGTNNPATIFTPNKKQLYALQQFKYTLPAAALSLVAAIGFDTGDLSDVTGFMVGIKKQFGGFAKK